MHRSPRIRERVVTVHPEPCDKGRRVHCVRPCKGSNQALLLGANMSYRVLPDLQRRKCHPMPIDLTYLLGASTSRHRLVTHHGTMHPYQIFRCMSWKNQAYIRMGKIAICIWDGVNPAKFHWAQTQEWGNDCLGMGAKGSLQRCEV
jgi:hypothetical protein